MARLYTLGFEVQSSLLQAEDPGCVFAGGATTTTTNPRSGLAACSFSSVTNGNVDIGGASPISGATTGRSYFARMYWRASAATPSVRSSILAPFVSGGTWHAVCWETDGTLSLYDKGAAGALGTKIGSSSVALSANTYYRIELEWRVEAAGTGVAGLYLDGSLIARSTSATVGNAAFTELNLGSANLATSTWTGLLDDVALNDDTGADQNTLPGPGKIVLLKPISDNARTGFTGGAGGTTSLFDAVNNYPPIGAATPGTNLTQIGSATNNATDSYSANVTTYTTAGVGASDVVTVATAIGRVGNSTTTTRNLGLQSTSNPAIGESLQATGATAAAAETTGWTTVRTVNVYNPVVAKGTSPVIRIRKATASTNNAMADMMGLVIEYRPGSLPSSSRAVRNMLVRR